MALLSQLLASLDPETRAQMMQESGGNPMAVSPKGAAGIMQIMPATARDPGYGVTPLQNWDGKDPRTAPIEEQLRFGRDYQAAMEAKFGSRAGGLAAYNAGPGRMEQVNAGLASMPAETRDYVARITGGSGGGAGGGGSDPRIPWGPPRPFEQPTQGPPMPQMQNLASFPPQPSPQPRAPQQQALASLAPQQSFQSADNYEDRTAGLKNFNAGGDRRTSTMTSEQKFGALVQEARQPGSFEASQQPQMQPPQKPGALANIASAFIPFLGPHLDQQYNQELTKYAMSAPPEQALAGLAAANPNKYLPMLLEYNLKKAAPAQPQTELGKLKADYLAGFIPEKAYQEKLSEVTRGGTENIPGLELAGDYKPSQQDTKEIKAISQAKKDLEPLFELRRGIIKRNASPMPGTPEALDLQQNSAQIALKLKGLEQTGALDKGSVDVIMEAIGNPVMNFEFSSPLKSLTSMYSKYQGGEQFAGDQLDQALRYINQSLESAAGARGYRSVKPAQPNDGLTAPMDMTETESLYDGAKGWKIERVNE